MSKAVRTARNLFLHRWLLFDGFRSMTEFETVLLYCFSCPALSSSPGHRFISDSQRLLPFIAMVSNTSSTLRQWSHLLIIIWLLWWLSIECRKEPRFLSGGHPTGLMKSLSSHLCHSLFHAQNTADPLYAISYLWVFTHPSTLLGNFYSTLKIHFRSRHFEKVF